MVSLCNTDISLKDLSTYLFECMLKATMNYSKYSSYWFIESTLLQTVDVERINANLYDTVLITQLTLHVLLYYISFAQLIVA